MSRTPGGVSEEIRRRHAWLELLQVSGPFLTLPVVHRVFPNGLAEVPAHDRAKARAIVAQMMDDGGASRHTVIETLLRDVFDWQQHRGTERVAKTLLAFRRLTIEKTVQL